MKGFFKKSGIYFDTEVKKGSNNAITSDAVAKAIAGGGGGGGSTDYADLTNKPKINNVELSGNKSSSDLGLANEANLNTLSDNVGDLSNLTTTDKTSIVNAINEVAGGGGGGGSVGGVKFTRTSGVKTSGTVNLGGISYVTFTEDSIKGWFLNPPNSIDAIIAIRNGGTVVKVAIKTVNYFLMEQSNSPISYDFIGVFYE